MPLAKQRASVNWYVRRAVPKELRKIIGKYEIWQSTRTPDKQTALRRSRQIEAKIDTRFQRARAQRSPSSVDRLPEDQLIRLAREVFQSVLASYEDDIALGHDLSGLDMQMMDLSVGLSEGDWDKPVLDWVNETLARAGFEVAEGPGYWKAVTLLVRAKGAALTTAQAQAGGDYGWVAHDPLVTEAPSVAPAVATGISVRDLVERHAHDPSRANVGEKSQLQYNTIYKVLSEVAGATTPVNQVSREDTRRIREALMARGLATTTVNSYLTNLSAIFEYALREEYVEKNVAKGLSIRSGPHKQDLRHPFSEAQLRRIFTSSEWRKARGAARWVPLLSLYAGLRLSEACQLLKADICDHDGVWCVSVAPGAGKRVKSRAGQRLVPIHPRLIELGFLEFVRAVNTERLFDDLPGGTRGYAGEAYGKRFARFLKKIDADEPRTSFHSLRHCFRDALRNAQVPEEIAKALGGWASNGGTSSLYGSGFGVQVLKGHLEKIEPLPEGLL